MKLKPFAISLLAMLVGWLALIARGDELQREFAVPDKVGRPGTWWRWVNGNITKDSIARDLHEMARLGIHRVGIFDVDGPAPVGGVGMMKPEWREMFRFAVETAAKLGLEIEVTPAAGWGIGGPWIDEAHATKALRSVQIQTEGPAKFDDILPRASGAGPYYRNVAVLAFKEPATRPAHPMQVTASSVLGGYQKEENWPPEDATDGDPDTFWKSGEAPSPSHPVWIELRYAQMLTVTSVFVAGIEDAGPQSCQLQVSANGHDFQTLTSFSLPEGKAERFSFPAATGKIFRLSITAAHSPEVRLAELQLLRDGDEPVMRRGIKYWWLKSGNRAFWDWPKAGPAALDEEYAGAGDPVDCRADEVIDLTSRVSPEGRLRWEVPAGRWTIIQFGSVILGESSRWMSRALQGGYEADPYSPAAAETLYKNTAGLLAKDVGPLAGKTFTGIVVDSYEIGATVKGLQGTWTDDFREQFVRRRGYDPLPFLPAMAQRIVDSRDTTNRFLWDYRQTLAELYLEFYRRLAALAHQDGLRLTAENGYGSYPFPQIDGLAAFACTDVPMGEFWYNRTILSQFYPWADSVRTAASAAHVYGKKFVGAETLTIANGLLQTPGEWKTQLDREFCNGMNLVTLNCWSLQYDVTARPGLYTYDLLNENLTWWEQSRAFLDYIARCQHLLQQGIPVADACYFYGEGTGKFVPGRQFIRPTLPAGYEFDGIDATALVTRLSYQDGKLVLPNGISYRYLVLPDEAGWKVTPETLRSIQGLVQDGATVVGPRPGGAPGLGGGFQRDSDMQQLISALWPADPAAISREPHGAGRVLEGKTMAELFVADGVTPDVDLQKMTAPQNILWCHRRAGEMEIYFLSNQSASAQTGAITFRVKGKQPEFWDPLNGTQSDAGMFASARGRTEVPVSLAPNGSLFVVFRRPADGTSVGPPNSSQFKPVAELTTGWKVTFDPKAGGPDRPVEFQILEDWSKRTEPEIRYYSGTATYRIDFDLPAGVVPADHRWFLDLGLVKNVAQLRFNGQDLGVLWTAPWQVEITPHLKTSHNHLEITVANSWANRLIGDQRLPVGQRLTVSNFQKLKANSPLAESGLLGPVTLQTLEHESK